MHTSAINVEIHIAEALAASANAAAAAAPGIHQINARRG
jgi:hypothetical protein